MQAPPQRWVCLLLQAFRGLPQSFGGGIVTDGLDSTPELFVQLCEIPLGFPKIRGSLQGLRIGNHGTTSGHAVSRERPAFFHPSTEIIVTAVLELSVFHNRNDPGCGGKMMISKRGTLAIGQNVCRRTTCSVDRSMTTFCLSSDIPLTA